MSIKKEGYRMSINDLVLKVNDVLTGSVLIIALVGIGLLFTFKLGFIQIRGFKDGWNRTFGGLFSKKGDAGKDGMSSFQALATAIAAQVGTGNIAGAATAIAVGGPGAIFWMWISAFLGMATIYGEAVLAQTYKTEVNGEVTGGPVYYIKAAFKGTFGKALSTLFAVFIILALGFMGNMVQSNSIGAAFVEAFQVFHVELSPVIVGIVVAVIAAVIFLGGTKSLATVVEKIVPIMAGVYIVGSLVLICMNITALPAAFLSIIEGAFAPEAVLGAGAGITVREAIRYGVARGLFSNEAGMGSTPHAHARAKAESPHHQGLCAMVSVFIDTFIVLNLTVFSVLTTGVMSTGKDGTALTQAAFMKGFGSAGIIFVAVCLFFFAFSTILSWHFFGLVNVKYLFGEKASKLYSLIVVACIVIGSCLKLELVWSLADFFNGLMVIPNVLALLALSGLVARASKER